MEAVNSESLQQSINIEHLNRITLDNNDCLSAINLGKNSWKFNASTDLLKYDNNKATTEHIYNNKYNNTNEKSYTTVEAEEEEAESESHMNNDSSSNTQEFENNKIVVDNERTHNNILHKIEDKIIENIFKKNCLNHILTNEQNKHNQTEQLNSNCENLQNNINKNKDNDNNEEQEEEKPVSTNCVKEEKIEKELILDNNHQTNNDINLLNNNNNVPTTTTNGEQLEETEKKKEEKEQVENEKEKVPVELTTDISADAKVEIKQTTINSRSRCSSISSIASNYSTSSGNTPNLVIDHLVAAQQFSKRKVSSWSSSSDTEEPAAKQAHLDTADAQPDPSASSRETTSSSSSSSSSDENEDKTENCNAVVQQQSPLKIKIVQNPASIEENKCHEIADTEISAQQPKNDCDNNDSPTTIMQEISPTTENTTDFVDHLNTKNQLETTATTITSPTPKTVGTTVISSLAEPETVIKKKNTKSRYYKCASCRTLHEGWNFFMHIYETHQRYICLYCIKVFATAEKLSVHLEIKHDLEQDHFNSEEALRHYEHVECQAKYLMCCTCQHMFIDQEPFSNHDCNMYMRPCALCGQMGRHSNNCKAHPDATRRNNKIKAKPPPNSNRQQATSNINAIGAVTDCDKVEATLKGIPQQQQQQQQTFEQSNEITHLPQQASSVDNNLQETTQEKPTIEAVEEVEQEENEEIGEEEVVEEEIPPKLVVPKFKLRVPKEFQKSVDAVISSSEESENDSDNISTGSEVEQEEREVEIEAQPENLEINAEKKALEADLDVSDDTDSPTENCLNKSMSMDNSDLDTTESRKIFKEEWEQRLKESVHDMKLLNSQQDAVMETEEAEEKVNETSMNGTATHTQWSPTPPASPKISTQQENEPTTEQNEPTLLPTTNEEEPIAEALPQTEIVNSEIEPQVEQEVVNEEAKLSPKIDIEAASEEDALPIQIKLDRPLDLYENPVEFIRYCLNYSFPICLYCNHARRIAVNAQILVTHMLENHRYTPAVNGITAAEDIKASSLMDKLKAILSQLQTELYINGNNFNSLEENKVENERIYECFMCRFITKTHKELYLHNRKMHLRSAVLCFMCRAHFVSFTEVLCHICPGAPHKQLEIDIKYRCCLCNLSNIPSSFRLMVHLRKKHNSCDVCLEDCVDQTRLSSHVWKHKFRHYCYRCNISYRNKNDIINHLYWKHGTESTPCKRCQSKRWRHVYHFCTPNGSFVCETCNECFSKVMYLNVHQRLHAGELKYACEMENCVEKFISRRLLHKHKQEVHKPPITELTETEVEKGKKDEEEEETAVTVKESEQKLSEEVEKGKEAAESEQQEKSTKEDNMEDTAEVETMKNRKQVLTFDVLNLSESSDSSSDGENSDTEQQQHKIERLTRITDESSRNADETDNNKLLALNENEKLDKDNNNMEKSENTENVLDIWKNFLNAQAQKNTEDLEEQEELAVIDEDCRPSRLHVAYSDHDYCCLFNPNEHKKKERNKEEKERKSATPTTEKVQVTLTDNEANNESSSDSESSDESGCSCGSNCSNCGSSSSNSDSDSSNSNSSDSDSSDDSHKSHQKKSLNKSKDSNSNRSPHKKHHRHDSVRTEIQVDDTDNHEEVAMEIEPPRAPQIFESDLETSDLDSDEEFYAEHPRKEAQEMLIKEQAAVVNEVNNELTKTEDILANGGGGGGGVDNLLDNEHDNDKKERKKLKKKKRDKRNNNNNSNKEPQNNVILNNIMQQCQNNQMYNIFSTTAVEPALGMDGAYNAHMPFAAEQTVITGAHSIISEGGGSSSEADGSLKRSKRMRRPNKFYGYTSDDETMSGQQQSLMIGSRAFKPQPPPQLTWNKDDLPTPSKSILNQNKAPRSNQRPSKATPTRNLDEAFGEFAQLINQDTRKRTFGIAAGGKIGGDGAFYKRAAKKGRVKSRQLSSTEEEGGYNLPPIPRLKIKPSQIGLNLDILKKKRINSTSSSSASSSEDEFVPTEVNTQAAKTLNVKPHLQFNALATPTAVLQAQQQHQQQQSQEQASLPTAISTPIPKTTAFNHSIPPALLPNPDFATLQYFKANNIRYPIRPPAGARQAREGESVYCYCRCPYDEVSEMIACDGDNCVIEWFHFECVGIMMAPQGKWYCAECRPKYISNSLTNLVKPPF